MLRMPDEPGLIPFGIYKNYHTKQPYQVFVRSHTDLGHGLFLIEYTNAKSGKSKAWRTAIVRQGLMHEPQNGSWGPTTTETWEDLAVVKPNTTRHGHRMAKGEVIRPVQPDQWRYKTLSSIYGEDFDEVVRDTVALTRSIYEPRD